MPNNISYNLEPLYSGDTRDYYLTFTDANGDAIDITDWKVYFTMKLNYADSDDVAAVKKDSTSHTDPENGKTKINLNNGDTGGLIAGNYFYDVQVKKDNGDILTVMSGMIEILTDITRRVD